MKSEYPRYLTSRKKGQGGLQKVKQSLKGTNQKIFNDFIEFVCLTVKKDSVKMHNIERAILQFYDVLEKDLDNITREDVIKFFSLLNTTDRKDSFKDEMKVYIKKFLKWYYKDTDMIDIIKLSNKRYNEERINKNSLLTPDEIKKIVNTTESPKFKAWFMLAFESAGRPEELAKLCWKDVKFKQGYAEVNLFSGKTKKSRVVIIKEASKLLKLWREISPHNTPNDFIFFSPLKKDSHMTVGTLNMALKRAAQKSGIDRPVWNYLVRHSNLTKLYSKLPQPLVEKYAGHKGMADIYAHLDDDDIKQAMLKDIYSVKELTTEQKAELKKLEKRISNVEAFMKEVIERSISEAKKKKNFISLKGKDGKELKVEQLVEMMMNSQA